MACPDCPAKVPVISQAFAATLVVRLSEERKRRVALACLEWLTRRDAGLKLYEGINGREYSDLEKDLIALEVPVVTRLPCPLYAPKERNKCVLGGLGQHGRLFDPGAAPYGWLPTMLLRLIDPVSFRAQVVARQVADAKVGLLTRKTLLDPRHEGTLTDFPVTDRANPESPYYGLT